MSCCRVHSDRITSRFVLPFVLVCFGLPVSAQQSPYPVLPHVDSAEVWFDNIVNRENAAIVNGPAYIIPFRGYNSHPFYQSPESDRTFLRYDNDLYRNVD